jgi:DNA-directed RNA polymerase beta' subunit
VSTTSKTLDPKQTSEATIARSKKSVDRSVRALMQEMEHENTLVQETTASRLQRVLKIFRGMKPLFAVLTSLPLIPATWRAAIAMLVQALDALALVGPEITADFKAGKDL